MYTKRLRFIGGNYRKKKHSFLRRKISNRTRICIHSRVWVDARVVCKTGLQKVLASPGINFFLPYRWLMMVVKWSFEIRVTIRSCQIVGTWQIARSIRFNIFTRMCLTTLIIGNGSRVVPKSLRLLPTPMIKSEFSEHYSDMVRHSKNGKTLWLN